MTDQANQIVFKVSQFIKSICPRECSKEIVGEFPGNQNRMKPASKADGQTCSGVSEHNPKVKRKNIGRINPAIT